MKEPSPSHALPPQHSNTTNLLNKNFPGVIGMHLVSHFHVIDKCCHGDFYFFFPTCKCTMRLCKQRTVQWHHVHRGTIHIMSLYIYYYKCLSESSNVYSNQTRILQQFCNKWQGCHLIICMKMPHRLEVVLCSYLDLEHYQLQAGLMKMGQGPPSSSK